MQRRLPAALSAPVELLRAVDVRAVDALERGGEDTRNVLSHHRQTDAFVAHVLSWYRWVNARAVSFSDAASPVAL